jgi:transposase
MRKTFEKMPLSRVALETGTHSPWLSRLLTELGHEAIVAHARNVRLIGESRRKDDRLDAQALARLARIDPQLLSPIQHRNAPRLRLTCQLSELDMHWCVRGRRWSVPREG